MINASVVSPEKTVLVVASALLFRLAGVIPSLPFLAFWKVAGIRPGAVAQAFAIVADALLIRIDDTVDDIDLSARFAVTVGRAFNATIRTLRTAAQYAPLKRRRQEDAFVNVQYFTAYKLIRGVNLDASGAGFGVTERGKGEQQASSNQGFHVAPFCFGSNLRTTLGQYNLG